MRISSKQFCLEDNTELSESNLGRSLRIYKARRDGCLEDSTHYFPNTRDFVQGYSRCARYWLPAKSTIYATKQPKTDTYFYIFLFIIALFFDILFLSIDILFSMGT